MGRHWIVLHNLLIRYKWWSMSYSKIVQQKNTSDTWASISQISRTQILRWNPDALGIPTFSPAGRSSRINFSMDRWRNRLEHLSPNSLSIRHSPFKKGPAFISEPGEDHLTEVQPGSSAASASDGRSGVLIVLVNHALYTLIIIVLVA